MARSMYYSTLHGDIKCQYDEKLKLMDSIDPYSLLLHKLFRNIRDLTNVILMKLVNYLHWTTNEGDKSLQAYKHYKYGGVSAIFSEKIHGDAFVILGKERAPLVAISDGQIKGTSHRTGVENRIFYAYRGIPFAKPPLGDLRFAAPVKNDPWNGTLDATKDQNSCVQMNTSDFWNYVFVEKRHIFGSEDCLYINVYTTDVDGSLPVMVWIHGGTFISGSSNMVKYPPDNFLDKDVIFVSFNYRLGVFGFLSTEDENASGNWGIKDQVMALRWVKQNIRYFGGDPNKITIFGESAGGASVSYLMQIDMAKGLFNRAIMQSGTSLCLWALSRDARKKAFELGNNLNIYTLDSKSLISDLRKANYTDLKVSDGNVFLRVFLDHSNLAGLPFGVVTEPDIPGAVFSKKSWELLSTGQFQRVPSIVGYNSNEFPFLSELKDFLSRFLAYWKYTSRAEKLFAPYDLTQNETNRLTAGTIIRSHYFDIEKFLSEQPEAVARFVNVDQFNRPIREYVNQVSNFSTVYYYQFSYSGLLGNQRYKGAVHAGELPYFFNTKNSESNGQNDFTTSQRVITLWTNFAKTGNPTPPSSSEDDNILGGITWEPNNSTTNSRASIKYLNINSSLTMESNPFQADWNFYQDIYDRFGDPPYTTH